MAKPCVTTHSDIVESVRFEVAQCDTGSSRVDRVAEGGVVVGHLVEDDDPVGFIGRRPGDGGCGRRGVQKHQGVRRRIRLWERHETREKGGLLSQLNLFRNVFSNCLT